MFTPQLVSFVIPVKSPEDFSSASLLSIQKQQCPGITFEIILINNSSRPLQVQGITVLHEPRQGASYARNKGLEVAKGQWVAFVDCDVELELGWLQAMMQQLLDEPYAGAQGSLVMDGRKPHSAFGLFRSLTSFITQDGMEMAGHFFPILNTSACIYNRERVGDFRFNEAWPKAEDAELSWRLYSQRPTSWVYVKEARAHCFFTPENFLAFYRRNFFLGRSYKKLVNTYAGHFPNIHQWYRGKFVSQGQNLLRQSKAFPPLIVGLRLVANLCFWMGYFLPASASREVVVISRSTRMTNIPSGLLFHHLQTGTRHFEPHQR